MKKTLLTLSVLIFASSTFGQTITLTNFTRCVCDQKIESDLPASCKILKEQGTFVQIYQNNKIVRIRDGESIEADIINNRVKASLNYPLMLLNPQPDERYYIVYTNADSSSFPEIVKAKNAIGCF
jgi:hypothetical protein